MADQTPDRLRQILERIREETEHALSLLRGGPGEERALAWKCRSCGYIKHFTKAVTLEALARCPRCKSDQFRPLN
jgi:predicted Zn-ribbon and HTH transcriptional regulator